MQFLLLTLTKMFWSWTWSTKIKKSYLQIKAHFIHLECCLCWVTCHTIVLIGVYTYKNLYTAYLSNPLNKLPISVQAYIYSFYEKAWSWTQLCGSWNWDRILFIVWYRILVILMIFIMFEKDLVETICYLLVEFETFP